MPPRIELLARAIIQTNGKILVARKLNQKYFFFPGGHIEFRESAQKALRRELREELGLACRKCSFIGGSEHVFTEESKKHHEINLAFQVQPLKLKTKSRENHLRFSLIDKNKLTKQKILPASLKKAVSKYLKDKQLFWVSEI